MKNTQKHLFWCLVFLLLSSCYPTNKRSYYPEDILGERIAFYSENKNPCQPRRYRERDFLYEFHTDRTFIVNLNGDVHQSGTFYYNLKGDQATLMIYTQDKSDDYSYEIEMTYESAYAGRWMIKESSDPSMTTNEKGTFRFI